MRRTGFVGDSWLPATILVFLRFVKLRQIEKKVLVTGATGFVGTALCTDLISRGYAVRGLTRSESKQVTDSNFELAVAGDIGGELDWGRYLEGVGFVVHLAARVHIPVDTSVDSKEVYRLYERVNVDATRRLLDAAILNGVKRFIFLSTIKVNGEGAPFNWRESSASDQFVYTSSDDPRPEGPYAQSKWAAEKVVAEAHNMGAIETVIIRPPLVYGPGVKGNFWKLLRAIDREIPLPFGSVSNKRSLIYIGSLVDAIAGSLSAERMNGKVYLISDGEDISTAELVARLARALERRSRLVGVPSGLLSFAARIARRHDMLSKLLGTLVVDSQPIRRDLEWTPPYSIEQGLVMTANWYKDAIGANRR